MILSVNRCSLSESSPLRRGGGGARDTVNREKLIERISAPLDALLVNRAESRDTVNRETR